MRRIETADRSIKLLKRTINTIRKNATETFQNGTLPYIGLNECKAKFKRGSVISFHPADSPYSPFINYYNTKGRLIQKIILNGDNEKYGVEVIKAMRENKNFKEYSQVELMYKATCKLAKKIQNKLKPSA